MTNAGGRKPRGKSPRDLGKARTKGDPFAELRKQNPEFRVDYKDTTLLRRFISDRGKIRSRRVTGLNPQDQRAIATAVRNAREMALLPYPGGGGSKG